MKVIEKRGSEHPSLYEIKQNAGTTQLLINVDVRQEQAAGPESGEDQWMWNALTFAPGEHSYGAIVDALIQHEYPYSRMEAVRNNHDIGTHIEEWEAMQEYRKYAKQLARTIVNEFEPNPEEE